MKKMSPVVLPAIVLIVFVMLPANAFAADLVINARILQSLAIEFTPAIDPWEIGDMVPFSHGATPPLEGSFAENSATVKNVGSGPAVDYCLSLTATGGWTDEPGVVTLPGGGTLEVVPYFNVFALLAAFQADPPGQLPWEGGDYENVGVRTTEKCANGYDIFFGPSADESSDGYNVSQNVTQNLYLLFLAPSGTDIYDIQTITLTVTAQPTTP